MTLFFFIQLATLLAITLAFDSSHLPCGVPFPTNDETLSAFSALFNETLSPFSLGSSDLLNFASIHGGSKPWPRDESTRDKLVTITYCYEKIAGRVRLSADFEAAIGVWMHALGGKASKNTGHGLEFREAKDGKGNPLYCFQAGANDFDWNERISFDALRVKEDLNPHVGGWATIGYSQTLKPVPKSMTIALGSYTVPTIVHELGHVLGMAHEHQRSDRDRYINFRCDKLVDFGTKFAQLQKVMPNAKWSDLCENQANAIKVGFSGTDYIKGSHGAGPHDVKKLIWPVEDRGEPYDINSVMHYPSYGQSSQACLLWRMVDACPLVKYKVPGDGSHGYEFIDNNLNPSPGDAKWVKDTYPWKGA